MNLKLSNSRDKEDSLVLMISQELVKEDLFLKLLMKKSLLNMYHLLKIQAKS